jgi:HAD superfamily hydrolase (TIGR01509 family)
MAFRAVIFDVDGTLVDSNDAHAEAWVQAFFESGLHVDPVSVRRSIGMGGDKLIPIVSGTDADSPLGRQIAARRTDIFEREHLPSLRAFPRASELVSTLRDRGWTLAVASSAKRRELEMLLTITGLSGLLEKRSSGDDVEESKPEPDIVLSALEHLRVPAAEAVMIGDTPYDVTAATRAGVATIALRSRYWKDADLNGALAIYDDVADLMKQFDSSALGDPMKADVAR